MTTFDIMDLTDDSPFSTNRFSMAVHMRKVLISNLAEALSVAVMDSSKNSSDAKMLAAFEAAYKAAHEMVKALSSSSSAVYAVRDLPAEEAQMFAKIEHALSILRLLYGVREERA